MRKAILPKTSKVLITLVKMKTSIKNPLKIMKLANNNLIVIVLMRLKMESMRWDKIKKCIKVLVKKILKNHQYLVRILKHK